VSLASPAYSHNSCDYNTTADTVNQIRAPIVSYSVRARLDYQATKFATALRHAHAAPTVYNPLNPQPPRLAKATLRFELPSQRRHGQHQHHTRFFAQDTLCITARRTDALGPQELPESTIYA
jgi:hypothetical protein